MLMIYHVKT